MPLTVGQLLSTTIYVGRAGAQLAVYGSNGRDCKRTLSSNLSFLDVSNLDCRKTGIHPSPLSLPPRTHTLHFEMRSMCNSLNMVALASRRMTIVVSGSL